MFFFSGTNIITSRSLHKMSRFPRSQKTQTTVFVVSGGTESDTDEKYKMRAGNGNVI